MKQILYLALMAVLILLACGVLPTPTATPEPTATWTPEPTPTPVVIVVTATPAPEPTVDPYDLVFLPREVERFAAQLVQFYGGDFAYARRLGVSRDTVVYLTYESPIGSGQFYVASYSVQGDEWKLLDRVQATEPRPTPTPAATPGAVREAREW